MELHKTRHSRNRPTLRACRMHWPKLQAGMDAGFEGNDRLKANAVQLFKARDVVFRVV